MLRQLAKYGAGLIALYLVVANATGFGQTIEKGAGGVANITKTLQGR